MRAVINILLMPLYLLAALVAFILILIIAGIDIATRRD